MVFRERARNSLRKRAHLGLERRVRGDAAVVGSTERARGSGQAAARQRSGVDLKGQVRTDAAVVGGTERARGGGQAAPITSRSVSMTFISVHLGVYGKVCFGPSSCSE